MNRSELIHYLSGADDAELFARSHAAKPNDKLYLRGLIEVSNRCAKNCLYCGIRCGNRSVARYELSTEQIVASAKTAIELGYGSVVLQAGERTDTRWTGLIEEAVAAIRASDPKVGITLSLGEQSAEVYQRWRTAGATRYLLRLESFSEALYKTLHPSDHSWAARRACLDTLRTEGYQVGTGVMIGLPGQTLADLADDLLAMQALDIDMCGMGPYVEHPDAPLGSSEWSVADRVALTLRMVALLRLMMPSINIAATTALDALDAGARRRCVEVGANVAMPNLSPEATRGDYALYAGKPTETFSLDGFDVAWGEAGDSLHYIKDTQRAVLALTRAHDCKTS